MVVCRISRRRQGERFPACRRRQEQGRAGFPAARCPCSVPPPQRREKDAVLPEARSCPLIIRRMCPSHEKEKGGETKNARRRRAFAISAGVASLRRHDPHQVPRVRACAHSQPSGSPSSHQHRRCDMFWQGPFRRGLTGRRYITILPKSKIKDRDGQA